MDERGFVTETNKDMKQKPEVGQTVYIARIDRGALGETRKEVVTKVGSKYFTVGKGLRDRKFRITDWVQETQYSATHLLFESEQKYKDHIERSYLLKIICGSFPYSLYKLPLQGLRDIQKIIDSRTAD